MKKKKYVTKTSSKINIFKSGSQREIQEEKPRFDLILLRNQKYEESMLYRLAMLMSRGAKKYCDRNWERANSIEELERFKSGAFRHFVQWFCNVDDNEDHASAIFFNIIAAEYTKEKLNKVGKKEK